MRVGTRVSFLGRWWFFSCVCTNECLLRSLIDLRYIDRYTYTTNTKQKLPWLGNIIRCVQWPVHLLHLAKLYTDVAVSFVEFVFPLDGFGGWAAHGERDALALLQLLQVFHCSDTDLIIGSTLLVDQAIPCVGKRQITVKRMQQVEEGVMGSLLELLHELVEAVGMDTVLENENDKHHPICLAPGGDADRKRPKNAKLFVGPDRVACFVRPLRCKGFVPFCGGVFGSVVERFYNGGDWWHQHGNSPLAVLS